MLSLLRTDSLDAKRESKEDEEGDKQYTNLWWKPEERLTHLKGGGQGEEKPIRIRTCIKLFDRTL